jgi:surface antigen
VSYVVVTAESGFVYAGPVQPDKQSERWTEKFSECTWFATEIQAKRMARVIDKMYGDKSAWTLSVSEILKARIESDPKERAKIKKRLNRQSRSVTEGIS